MRARLFRSLTVNSILACVMLGTAIGVTNVLVNHVHWLGAYLVACSSHSASFTYKPGVQKSDAPQGGFAPHAITCNVAEPTNSSTKLMKNLASFFAPLAFCAIRDHNRLRENAGTNDMPFGKRQPTGYRGV